MFVVSPSSKTLLSFYDRGFAFFSGPNNIPLFSKTARVFMKFLELQLLFPKKKEKRVRKFLSDIPLRQLYHLRWVFIILLFQVFPMNQCHGIRSLWTTECSDPLNRSEWLNELQNVDPSHWQEKASYLTVVVVKTSSLFFTQLENILQSLEAGEMALVSVNNPSNNELVSATSGQVALQQVWFIQCFFYTILNESCVSQKRIASNHMLASLNVLLWCHDEF